MELHDDKIDVKERILDNLGKSIKLVQRYALCGYEGVVVIGNDSWLVQSLCHSLDLVLLHGLRDLHRGYWSIVREFSHSESLRIVQSLKTVTTSLGKGRAWLYYTLTEGSLQSYLHCLCQDVKILHKYYVTQALLRDTLCTQQLLTLLAGLEQVQFNLDPDVGYLDMAAYQQQHSEVLSDLLPSCGDPSNMGPRMTSSVSSSLASPVDSGVALMDSDVDAMSVSEATINETDNFSLRDDKEDDSTFNEIEDNRINHQLQTLETLVGKENVEIETREEADSCNIVSKRTDTVADLSRATQCEKTHLKDDQSELTVSPPNHGHVNTNKIEDNKKQHIINEGDFNCECSKGVDESASFYTKTGAEITNPDGPIVMPVARLVGSSGSEVVGASGIFHNCAFSMMTESDIVNQNVSENPVSPSEDLNCDMITCVSFVESKNRVNSELNVLDEDDRAQQTVSIKTKCDVTRTLKQEHNKTTTGGDDIVFRRQRNKKKRNNGNSGSSSVDGTTKVKRVSFHEDFILNEHESSEKCQSACATDFSVSFLPPDSVKKRDAVKGRYSWCGEGDAPFVRRRNNDSDTKSDVYLSSPALTFSDDTICMEDPLARLDQNTIVSTSCTSNLSNQRAICVKEKCMILDAVHTPPVAERGTPEGQEDPSNSTSSLCIHNNTNYKQEAPPDSICGPSGNLKKFQLFPSSVDLLSDSESLPASDTEFVCSRNGYLITSFVKEKPFSYNYMNSSSLLDVRTSKPRTRSMLKSTPLSLISSREAVSKTSLLNRFMRSLAEKKFIQKKPKLLLKPSQSLYISGTRKLNHKEVLEHFKTELDAEMRLYDNVGHIVGPETTELEETFRTQVFLDKKEKLYKIFKVSSSYSSGAIGKPLLAILTNFNLYITGVKSNYAYNNHLVIPYTQLDAMLVGPNSQTVLLVSADKQTQFLIVTGNRATTEQLVGHIEIAMRRAPMKPVLPAIRVLELEDMKLLTKKLVQDASMLEDEVICHYSLVHLQDDHLSPPSTPMGPTKEGHLMFRPATDAPLQPWEPGFFILKAGVVYMFGDKSQRLPKRVMPLRWNGCRGCRRIPYAQRPHTFEILLGPRRSFQFAAADEYEASDWLQAFVQAASGVYEEEPIKVISCSLVVTERHLVTCYERPTTTNMGSRHVQILSCAAIQDLTAFITNVGHSWCVLEFACREVHESSGDWVLYFASSEEMCSFRNILQQLWFSLKQTDFPLRPSMDDSLGRRGTETSTLLAEAWDILLPVTSHSSL